MENEIVLFETEDHEVKLHVPVENNTVWLNRKQLAELFGRDVKTIGKHINNALKEELDNSVVANFATTAVNLSMVYAYYEIGRMIVEEEQRRRTEGDIWHVTFKGIVYISDEELWKGIFVAN